MQIRFLLILVPACAAGKLPYSQQHVPPSQEHAAWHFCDVNYYTIETFHIHKKSIAGLRKNSAMREAIGNVWIKKTKSQLLPDALVGQAARF